MTIEEKIGSASTMTAGDKEPTTANPPKIIGLKRPSDVCQMARTINIGNNP